MCFRRCFLKLRSLENGWRRSQLGTIHLHIRGVSWVSACRIKPASMPSFHSGIYAMREVLREEDVAWTTGLRSKSTSLTGFLKRKEQPYENNEWATEEEKHPERTSYVSNLSWNVSQPVGWGLLEVWSLEMIPVSSYKYQVMEYGLHPGVCHRYPIWNGKLLLKDLCKVAAWPQICADMKRPISAKKTKSNRIVSGSWRRWLALV